jgi:hypothetical protein
MDPATFENIRRIADALERIADALDPSKLRRKSAKSEKSPERPWRFLSRKGVGIVDDIPDQP